MDFPVSFLLLRTVSGSAGARVLGPNELRRRVVTGGEEEKP